MNAWSQFCASVVVACLTKYDTHQFFSFHLAIQLFPYRCDLLVEFSVKYIKIVLSLGGFGLDSLTYFFDGWLWKHSP